MHIPDGFLDARTWITTGAASAAVVGISVKKTRAQLDERQIPQLGLLSAFVFAAQLVNFPVAAGTSGHLLGAALAAILLGPWSSCLILTTVLIVQCFFFQDGGITALGANILNMAVIGSFGAYLVYRFLRVLRLPQAVAIFTAAWLSILLSAGATALELAISGTMPLGLVLPAMLGWHALIGIGEGLITVAVAALVSKAWPDLGQGQT